ncbi:unnamed protein product [Commensalibacter communis]|uniref:Uncharacterized protein n=1 Tax=Commensalibacter communis TaxID=2972786 RepID=A0A9W4TNU3_9PROT|nr:hypothetical protein [Commensalibacter communis]CAI3960681.1 unnamed protein product [Commensalibacter communis]CAI3962086.1 unnamed protein product [Commensalibacter communis]
MFTAIITAAWRGFGFDSGDEYKELRLGFVSFAIIQGTFWQQHRRLKEDAACLKHENKLLRGYLGWKVHE